MTAETIREFTKQNGLDSISESDIDFALFQLDELGEPWARVENWLRYQQELFEDYRDL